MGPVPRDVDDMPELPEVETIARDLAATLVGKRTVSVAVGWPGVVAFPSLEDFELGPVGRAVAAVSRRGKYLIIRLAADHQCPSEPKESWLLVHLGMTGTLCVERAPSPPTKHTRMIMELRDEDSDVQDEQYDGHHLWVRFTDPRKFGRLYLVSDPGQVVGKLGPEPLSAGFTPDALGSAMRNRSRRLKPLLLDQHFLAGLGNIYVDEALFSARLHPLRAASTLSQSEVRSLHTAIASVLRQAIANRGTTLDDYRDGHGRPGRNQHALRAVRRKAQPCPICGEEIQRIVVEGRGTYLCPACQG